MWLERFSSKIRIHVKAFNFFVANFMPQLSSAFSVRRTKVNGDFTFKLLLKSSNVRWLSRLSSRLVSLISLPISDRVKPIRNDVAISLANRWLRNIDRPVSALKSCNCAFRRATRGYRLLLRNASLATVISIQLPASNFFVVERSMIPFSTGIRHDRNDSPRLPIRRTFNLFHSYSSNCNNWH